MVTRLQEANTQDVHTQTSAELSTAEIFLNHESSLYVRSPYLYAHINITFQALSTN